jgi:hypothetical protein
MRSAMMTCPIRAPHKRKRAHVTRAPHKALVHARKRARAPMQNVRASRKRSLTLNESRDGPDPLAVRGGNPGIRESGNPGIRESGNPGIRWSVLQSSDPCGEPFFNFVLFCTFPADRATCFVVTDCWLREGLRLKVSPGRAGLWAGRLPKSAEQGGRAPPHRPGRRYRPLRSLAASGGLGSAPYAMVLYG